MNNLKVLSYNIATCKSISRGYWEYLLLWKHFRSDNAIIEKVSKMISEVKPDVIGLNEVDDGSIRSNHINQPKLIAKNTGYNFVYDIPHRRGKLQGTGNALLSKNPIESFKFETMPTPLIYEKLPKIPFLLPFYKRGFIESRIKFNKKQICFIVTHLDAFFGKSREKQLTGLIKKIKSIKEPLVLMGDFNTNYGTSLLKQIEKTGLNNASNGLPKKERLTFPSWSPRWSFDHVLTSSDFEVKTFSVLDYIISDHKPVYVELKLLNK